MKMADCLAKRILDAFDYIRLNGFGMPTISLLNDKRSKICDFGFIVRVYSSLSSVIFVINKVDVAKNLYCNNFLGI